MRPMGSPRELERRRFRALELMRQGYAPGDVARQLGVDRRSVRRGQASFRRGGARGLKARLPPGVPRGSSPRRSGSWSVPCGAARRPWDWPATCGPAPAWRS